MAQEGEAHLIQNLTEGDSSHPPEMAPSPQSPYPYPPLPQGDVPPQQGSYPPELQPYPAKPNSGYQPAPTGYGTPGYAEGGSVVTTQPVRQAAAPSTQSQPALGLGATVVGAVSTVFVACCLCWWALPFTIAGIILGVLSTSYGSTGNMKTARIHFYISIGLSIFGIVFAIIGAAVIIGVIVDHILAVRRATLKELNQAFNNI